MRLNPKTQAGSMPGQTGTAIHDTMTRPARRGSNDRRFGSLAVHSFAELDFMPLCIQPAAPQLFYMHSGNSPNKQVGSLRFWVIVGNSLPPGFVGG